MTRRDTRGGSIGLGMDIPLAPHGGGGVEFLARHFPDAPCPWIDLSTGINPWAYTHDAISDAAWRTLPSPSLIAACQNAVAEAVATDPARVALMPGSQAALSLLPRLFPPATVAIVEPTYAEHRAMWRLAGHDVRTVPDIDAAENDAVLLVVNPNNPDGRTWTARALHREAARRAERGQWLIVDEAFADPTPERSVVGGGGNLVILRSFGKFFGLAGIRLGAVVAPPEIVRRLEAMIGPWAVSGPALVLGARAYADRAWHAETRKRLELETTRLRAVLGRFGLRVVGGTALFTLIEHDDAGRLFTALCRNGLYVRRFDYNARWLRFGLPPDADAFARLEGALAAWASGKGEGPCSPTP